HPSSRTPTSRPWTGCEPPWRRSLSIEPCIEGWSVSRETRLELLRLMLLQRFAEKRIMALYRQGRIPGSVYTGYMQEAVGAGAGLALGPDDVVAPLNREQA